MNLRNNVRIHHATCRSISNQRTFPMSHTFGRSGNPAKSYKHLSGILVLLSSRILEMILKIMSGSIMPPVLDRQSKDLSGVSGNSAESYKHLSSILVILSSRISEEMMKMMSGSIIQPAIQQAIERLSR